MPGPSLHMCMCVASGALLHFLQRALSLSLSLSLCLSLSSRFVVCQFGCSFLLCVLLGHRCACSMLLQRSPVLTSGPACLSLDGEQFQPQTSVWRKADHFVSVLAFRKVCSKRSQRLETPCFIPAHCKGRLANASCCVALS